MALPGMEAPFRPPPAEWPGAVSAKFSDPITGNVCSKRQVETGCRAGAEHGIARNGLGRYFTDSAGLLPADGKRRYMERGSDVYEWKPSRRSLSEPGAFHTEKAEGRRQVEQPARQIVPMREKRHVRQASSKEEVSDRPIGPQTVYRENGLRASEQPAREVDLSSEMARKRRSMDLASQRNGVGCSSLGDKAYRHPEYERGFHKVGHLIVGSGFMRGHHKKTEPRNSTCVQLVMGEGKLRTYKEVQQEMKHREAEDEVAALTRSWEATTLKECSATFAELSDSEDEGAVASPEGAA